MADRSPDGTAFEVIGHAGPAVVLVHGLGLNRHAWQWQTEALSGSYRVVNYDLHGHGDSADPPEQPSLSMFSKQLDSLLDHLSIDRAAVLGFSLGGMIARRFAMDHPERLWALGILHSAHTRDRAAHDAIQARVHQVQAEGPAATAEAALTRWFTDDFRAAHPDMLALVRGWILANRKEVYAPIYQVLVDGVAELVKPDPAISVPTLVMTGDQDYGNSPAMSRAIADEIAGSRLVILPGSDVFNGELLSFLSAVKAHG